MEIKQIEKLAKKHSEDKDALKALMSQLDEESKALKKKSLKAIRKAVDQSKQSQTVLLDAVTESPELFEKPRSVFFHGLKVGFSKSKDKRQVVDDGRTIALIKKHLPEQQEILIQTTEKPVKKAIDQLDEKILKRIGVAVIPGKDTPFIKSSDNEIDKLVDALLKETEDVC